MGRKCEVLTREDNDISLISAERATAQEHHPVITKRKEERRMSEMQGRTLAVPADGGILCCTGANGKNDDHSSSGGLSWYFAQRAMPGLVYVATLNGYVASGPDKTKGGNERCR